MTRDKKKSQIKKRGIGEQNERRKKLDIQAEIANESNRDGKQTKFRK